MSIRTVRAACLWMILAIALAALLFVGVGGLYAVRLQRAHIVATATLLSVRPQEHGKVVIRYQVGGHTFTRAAAGYSFSVPSKIPICVSDSDPTIFIEPPSERVLNVSVIAMVGGIFFAAVFAGVMYGGGWINTQWVNAISVPRVVLSGMLLCCITGFAVSLLNGKGLRTVPEYLSFAGVLIMWSASMKNGPPWTWKRLLTGWPFYAGALLLLAGASSEFLATR